MKTKTLLLFATFTFVCIPFAPTMDEKNDIVTQLLFETFIAGIRDSNSQQEPVLTPAKPSGPNIPYGNEEQLQVFLEILKRSPETVLYPPKPKGELDVGCCPNCDKNLTLKLQPRKLPPQDQLPFNKEAIQKNGKVLDMRRRNYSWGPRNPLTQPSQELRNKVEIVIHPGGKTPYLHLFKNLKSVDCSYCENFSDNVIRMVPDIEELNFNYCFNPWKAGKYYKLIEWKGLLIEKRSFRQRGVPFITNANVAPLKDRKKLKHLKIALSAVDDDVFKLLPATLESLDISYTFVTEKGLLTIPTRLPNLKKLWVYPLEHGEKFSQEVLDHLGKAGIEVIMADNPRLHR